MRILKSILFRSLCAIAIGAMLVKYPEQGRTGFIMAIGALFLVSGMIAVASYFFQRRQAQQAAESAASSPFGTPSAGGPSPRNSEASSSRNLESSKNRNLENSNIDGSHPAPFPPFAGIGSVVLGILLILVPGTLVEFISVFFGAMILLGAFNQFFSLVAARRYANVPLFYWLLSSLLFVCGIIVILKPQELADFVIQICGWCFIVYAVQEILIGVQIAIYKRRNAK